MRQYVEKRECVCMKWGFVGCYNIPIITDQSDGIRAIGY